MKGLGMTLTKRLYCVSAVATVFMVFAGCSPKSSPVSPQAVIDPRGAKAASGFEASVEGWTISGDAQASSTVPDYNGTGGNPDGLIGAEDDVTGGTWYFMAPLKYLGDDSASYGKFLEYDLKTNDVSNPFDNYDVMIFGDANNVLVYHFPVYMVADQWVSQKIPLDTTDAGWAIVDTLTSYPSDFSTLAKPSQAQFRAVLSHVTKLALRGEFNSGPDHGSLDNVRFGAVN
jgi:Laminin B (Domain IV)